MAIKIVVFIMIVAFNSFLFRSLSEVLPAFVLARGEGAGLLCPIFFYSLIFLILPLLLSHFAASVRSRFAFPSIPHASTELLSSPSLADSSSAGRALWPVLSDVSRVPVASLTDQFLGGGGGRDECQELNHTALTADFARTIALLEASIEAEAYPASGYGGMVIKALSSMAKRWAAQSRDGQLGASAEKLASETMWLAQKMKECGAASEAVALAMWGSSRLPVLAISVKPRLQVLLVHLCILMFTLANSVAKGLEGEIDAASSRLAMLKAWLPLLCRTTTSSLVSVPILTFGKNADILKILEEMIEKLTHEEQKDVLYLWLHHYPVNADSHWL